MNKLEIFKNLHEQETPLLLANVWDAHTAKLAQDAGFKAVATSSHAIANILGYEDGEQMKVEELLFIIDKIVQSVTIPISVDFEAGYSDDPNIVSNNVIKLFNMGIVGINLEDGKVINGKRVLQDPEILSQKLKTIKSKCPIFINARIDTYTTKHEHPLEESLNRAKMYIEAGADGLFVPLIEKPEEIKEFTTNIHKPLNVFVSKTLPEYNALASLGVKRISHGAKQFEQLMKISNKNFNDFLHSKAYNHVLGTE